MIMMTAPEVKPFIQATGMNNNVLRLDDYVDVLADFSRGYNRSAGCVFFEKLDDNFLSVRYTPTMAEDQRRQRGEYKGRRGGILTAGNKDIDITVCHPVRLRKCLFSATLTHYPQKLAPLGLLNPKRYDTHQRLVRVQGGGGFILCHMV